jgi:hypothetical protein
MGMSLHPGVGHSRRCLHRQGSEDEFVIWRSARVNRSPAGPLDRGREREHFHGPDQAGLDREAVTDFRIS